MSMTKCPCLCEGQALAPTTPLSHLPRKTIHEHVMNVGGKERLSRKPFT